MTDGSATHEEHGHHVVPVSKYAMVICALFFLMALTMVMAFIDLGAWNPVIAIAIAVSKAVFIVLIFMNVYYSSKLTQIFVAGGFFWLLILFGMIIIDFLSRNMLVHPEAWE